MTMRIAAILICLFIAVAPAHSQSPLTGVLEIEFTGIHTMEGQIAAGLNSSPEGWPNEPEVEYLWTKEGLVEGTLVTRIEALAYGTYAISVLDDIDLDQEMKMFMGIPREGFGFSGDPPHRLSVPEFEECAFVIDRPFTRITIDMRYIAKRN